MKQKTREGMKLLVKIGAGVLALVMIIGVIIQGFMYI